MDWPYVKSCCTQTSVSDTKYLWLEPGVVNTGQNGTRTNGLHSDSGNLARGRAFHAAVGNDGGYFLRSLVDPSADDGLSLLQHERAQLRNEEEKVPKQIRIKPSQGDDLNIKGLRDSLGRIDVVCRYFCKKRLCCKKKKMKEALLCNHRFQSGEWAPSIKAWFISCSFWKVVYGSNYNGNVVRYNILKNLFNTYFSR